MNAKLEELLMKRYPKIFIQKDMSPQDTCMCWGISTGDGWFDLVDKLCSKIQDSVDRNNGEQVEAVQVKEKFGGLRFYVNHATDEIYKYIYDAENESLDTCEACGSKENVKQTRRGWISTLCKECMEIKDEK